MSLVASLVSGVKLLGTGTEIHLYGTQNFFIFIAIFVHVIFSTFHYHFGAMRFKLHQCVRLVFNDFNDGKLFCVMQLVSGEAIRCESAVLRLDYVQQFCDSQITNL